MPKNHTKETTPPLPPHVIQENGPREIAYAGRMIQIVHQPMRLPNGKECIFETAERSPGVRVLVTTKDSILLNREWRNESKKWDYRLPGGKVYDDLHLYTAQRHNKTELRNASQRAAAKELLEETGLVVDHNALELMGISVCGATIEWDLYYFRTKLDIEPKLRQPNMTEEGECTSSAFYSYAEALRLCMEGEVSEDRSVGVLMRFLFQAIPSNLGNTCI